MFLTFDLLIVKNIALKKNKEKNKIYADRFAPF